MPVFYFHGKDAYRARRAIEGLAVKYKAKTTVLDKDELEKQAPREWIARGVGGLFGKEMLVVRDAQDLPVGLQDEIIEALGEAKSSLCVIWEEEKKGISRFAKAFGKTGNKFDYLGLKEAEDWIKKEADKKGVFLEKDAAKILVGRVGGDSWRLITELERLAAVDGKVNVKDVEVGVVNSEVAEIFSTLDALVKKNKRKAVRGVERLLEEGNNEFYILSMLAYQFRTLWLVKEGVEEGKSQPQIAREKGINPYAVRKSIGVAKGFSAQYLREALTRILATDFSIKQGRVDARTGLMMLVVGLVQ